MGVYQWDGGKPSNLSNDRRQMTADHLLSEYRNALRRAKTEKWRTIATQKKQAYHTYVGQQVNFQHRYYTQSRFAGLL